MDTGETNERPTNIRQNMVNPDIGLALDDEVDSLNSPEDAVSIEARLEKFRDSWKKELKLKTTSHDNDNDTSVKNKSPRDVAITHSRDYDGKDVSDMERQAAELFEKGSNLEANGKLYDAVACYRRATQLVPDIEARMYFKEKANREQRKLDQEKQDTNVDVSIEPKEDIKELDLEDEINLVLKFNSLNISDNGKFFICQPSIPTRSTHFSNLPYEVVLYILRWVVSDELDMRSLETFGQVCRGFYIISREPEIWKLACLRIWSAPIIDQEDFSLYNDDWRTMFLEKPRVNVNGIYISKASYVRQGEASFQDVNYRPCYLVEYYRYLRFFPKGVIMMLNTPDDPYQTLPKLRSENASNLAIIRGHYRIHGSRINAVLKSRTTSVERITFGKRGHKNRPVVSEKDYNISLDIRNVKGSRNNQLVWSSYSVVSKKNNEFESYNTFDIVSLTKFPPFRFSRVKSYGLTSMAPLM